MLVHLALNLVNLSIISRLADGRLAFTDYVIYGGILEW